MPAKGKQIPQAEAESADQLSDTVFVKESTSHFNNFQLNAAKHWSPVSNS